MGDRTRVVLLGTGTPNPEPGRSGFCVAVIVDDRPFLFDAGPGIARMARMAYNPGVERLELSGPGRTCPWGIFFKKI